MVFHPGTTAIVGPNGSGKSNIGEAIMWALGEHNPHNLRCLASAELVYNGNGLRRPQNYAEVNLVVDNEEGGLPLGFKEVQITRRVDRSGEGECFINKSRCRLRDVQELFLATGLGRHGYWAVSQNQIESVLSARAEARRELIEEAAGTSRYRFRRQDVLRKLDATERNLSRVRDILAEVQAQLDPLAEEAEKARKYKVAASRFRELEVACLLDERRTVLAGLRRSESAQKALAEKLALAKEERNRAEVERQALENQERELEPALDQLRRQVAEVAGRRQSLQADLMVAQSDLRQALRDQEEAKQTTKRVSSALQEAKAFAEQTELRLRTEREGLQSLRLAREEKEKQLALAQQERLQTDEERQALEREELELESALDHIRAEEKELSEQRQSLNAQLAVGQNELNLALRHQRDTDAETERILASLAEANERIRTQQAALQAEESGLESLRQAKCEKSEQLARAKQVVQAEGWERIQEGLEGACRQAVTIKGQVGELRALIGSEALSDASRVAEQVQGNLSALSDMLLVLAGSRQRREEAEAWRERLAAELAELGAAFTAAEERVKAKRAALETAQRDALGIEQRRVQRQETARAAQHRVQDLEKSMRQRAVSLKQVEDQWSQLQERLAQSLQRRSSVREALSLLAHGLERGVEAREPGERLAVEVAELGGELRAAEERLKALNATLDAATRQILALGEDQKHERAAATDVEDAVRRAEDGASQCTKDLEQTETHWGRLQATLAELSQKRSAVSQRAFHIRDAEKKAAAAEEELSARLHQSELHLTRLELRLEAVEQRLVNEFGAGRSISSIVGAAHTNQPQEAETSQNALLSESQETPADAVPADFDRSKAEKEMALLKEELNLLGEVNLGSVYHYDRLAARKASLLEQSLDLEQGKESLRKAVQEIDRRTKSQFLSAFRKAGEEFQRLFQGLFGGGQTELLLTDPTDLLETGVEIKVRLPGKEMVNLLLLSGGEKSLTAIAFLFSLMAVRPSPFCLLDEVDAALDEPNSRKFSSLLQEMRDRTQFLVITHNPLTMESADYLYGVTLGDSGASRLLSVSLADGNGNGRRQHAPAT